MLVNSIKRSTLPRCVRITEEWLKSNVPHNLQTGIYFIPDGTEMPREVDMAYYALLTGGILALSRNQDGNFVQFVEDPYLATITISGIRFPKVEYLLLLNPDHFAAFMRALGTAKIVNSSLLTLDTSIQYFYRISKFFEIQRTNYRIAPEYASKNGWIRHEMVKYLYEKSLEMDAEQYQLAVCQYLAVAQLGFKEKIPSEATLTLTLDDFLADNDQDDDPDYVQLKH